MRRAVPVVVLTVTTLIGTTIGYRIGTHGSTDASGSTTRRPEVLAQRVTQSEVAPAPAQEVAQAADPAPPPPPPPPSTAAHAADKPVVAPTRFSAPAKKPTAPPRQLSAKTPKSDGLWAVVIGIDDYPGDDHDLHAAVADARDVDAALEQYGVPLSHRVVLLNGQASGDSIRSSVQWLVDHASADSTAVLFYAGHVRQVGGDRDHDGEEVDEAFVGSDGVDVLDGDIARTLHNLDARTMWIGVAGCYAGGFDDLLAPGRTLTAATNEDQLAYENTALDRSYMVEYMVHRAMLQGKAPGSVQESFNWAKAQIAHDYPNRVPVIMDRASSPIVLRQPENHAAGGSGGSGAAPSGAPPNTTSTTRCGGGFLVSIC
jgi:hypothetical protein